MHPGAERCAVASETEDDDKAITATPATTNARLGRADVASILVIVVASALRLLSRG